MSKSAARDTGYAPSRWEFDEEVTRVFDDMLARSIPQYEVMRKAVTDMARQFAVDNAHIVDLGASRGEATARLTETLGAKNHYTLVECSKPMLASLRERFKYSLTTSYGFPLEVLDMDLRTDYPIRSACVTLSVLCLQFTPIDYRQKIVRNVYKNTITGGAFIVVEKVLGASAEIDDALTSLYRTRKLESGYSRDEVERKKLSLEGVLVPVTAAWNEQLLRGAGFSQVDCFWRWANFAAWVAVKQ